MGDVHVTYGTCMAPSTELPKSDIVKGYDFNEGLDYHKLMATYRTTGFQGTAMGRAIEEINKMIEEREKPVVLPEGQKANHSFPADRKKKACTIYLGYTSNLISSGLREILRYLVQHNMVDVVVSSAGGIEEDFIKCLAPTYLGDFALKGADLREKRINRTGNLLVPNTNYCHFEDWIMPILDSMLEEQKKDGKIWNTTDFIHRLGKEINHPESVYYWAYKNKIPVYCPAITDGSIGDMLYFHSYRNPGLVIDCVQDIRRMDDSAVEALKSGIIILGGGSIKHHICNANFMRSGADYAVYVNTGQEFDGSDAGARPDEAVSWGKISLHAKPVKVYADATIVFPVLVAETFAKHHKKCTNKAHKHTESMKNGV